MRIAILGSGPSGLVAAHAAESYGIDRVTIYAPGQKSPVWGAQYLHQPIPGITDSAPPRVIRYVMKGQPEDYLRKVYGDVWDGHISDDLRDQAHLAWDLRAAYDTLWKVYEPEIQTFVLSSNNPDMNARNVRQLQVEHDMVVNTIPRDRLCIRRRFHRFNSTEIWAMGDSDKQSIPVDAREGIITYDGTRTDWYRTARIFGYGTVEWPGSNNRPDIPGVARVPKPVSHSCDCFPGIVHLGRMGRWDKSILLHNVYADMMEQLMLREEETA